MENETGSVKHRYAEIRRFGRRWEGTWLVLIFVLTVGAVVAAFLMSD